MSWKGTVPRLPNPGKNEQIWSRDWLSYITRVERWYGETQQRWKDQDNLQNKEKQTWIDLNYNRPGWWWWWWWWSRHLRGATEEIHVKPRNSGFPGRSSELGTCIILDVGRWCNLHRRAFRWNKRTLEYLCAMPPELTAAERPPLRGVVQKAMAAAVYWWLVRTDVIYTMIPYSCNLSPSLPLCLSLSLSLSLSL